MKKESYKTTDADQARSAFARITELYEDDFSYLDAEFADEDDLSEDISGSGNGKRQKSPARVAREKLFVQLYEAYMQPAGHVSAFRRQCMLDDLFSLLQELNIGWAYRKAAAYQAAGFGGVDVDMALSTGCSYVYDLLKAEREMGKISDHPVAYCLRVAQNKSIDMYFRSEFGRLPPKKKDDKDPDPSASEDSAEQDAGKHKRKEPWQVSLEQMQTDENGIYRGDRNPLFSTDPFSEPRRPRRETDEKTARLSRLYLGELMDYPDEPQKPLALMYGSVIFQIAKMAGGADRLSQSARKSTKLSSAAWAHQRMGNLTLLQLGEKSEQVVRRYYQMQLAWGPGFRQHMQEFSGTSSGIRWGEIVYTRTYGESETSNWIESIFESTIKKCARRLKEDPELREFAEESLSQKNKLRKAIEKAKKKEACR